MDQILSNWSPPKIFFHMRNGGHVAALRHHIKNDSFSHLDISRFFYRISKNKILRSLRGIGFPFYEANLAATHSVVIDKGKKFLPHGFCQSPLLASLCLYNSAGGKMLMRAPKKFSISVYVDDIIVSSKNSDASEQVEFCEALIANFKNSGFPISHEKLVVAEPEIVSFNVQLSKGSTLLTEERVRQFRRQVESNLDSHDALIGISRYIHQIIGRQGFEMDQFILSLTSP
jgi:hypothetical protein